MLDLGAEVAASTHRDAFKAYFGRATSRCMVPVLSSLMLDIQFVVENELVDDLKTLFQKCKELI